MNSDCALLLQTVLGERGCVDATLQDTTQTVPLVYRVVAEQNYYFIYAVSVIKALLHEKEAAFAQLARWQALRAAPPPTQPASIHNGPTSTLPNALLTPAVLPPIAPSDSLDVFITIIGGGTCCELLLRLLYQAGNNSGNSTISNGGPHRNVLVHPSHLSVITRQPERLAQHARHGVHCLNRHHSRAAVMQSDVVLLTCPPALFREVAHDLSDAPSTAAVSGNGASAVNTSNHNFDIFSGKTRKNNAFAGTGSSSSASVLQPNAVLLSCMAGVSARKVSMAFQRTPELTLVTCIPLHDGIADDTVDDKIAVARSKGNADANTLSTAARFSKSFTPPFAPASLREVAFQYHNAMERYKGSRMADMQCNVSFLRPAVLEQQMLARTTIAASQAAKTEWNAITLSSANRSFHATQHAALNGCSAVTRTTLAAPRLTDFTAGRQHATAPSLEAFLDLWRLLQAYVRTTFAEALAKARSRGHNQLKTGSSGISNSGGLISVVLPESSYGAPRAPGEVEAELLPALALLPASKTVALWEAWWRCGLYGRQDSGNGGGRTMTAAMPSELAKAQSSAGGERYSAGATAPSLSQKVTAVTGGWLGSVYADDAALITDLELRYQHVLEQQLPRTY